MSTDQIDLEGRRYSRVDRHRPENSLDSKLYTDTSTYLRIGPAPTIEANLRAHRSLEAAGFPVPNVISEGTQNEEKYFIENSVGEKTFRIRFAEEVKVNGAISDTSFNEFIEISRQYIQAQSSATVPRDEQLFLDFSHLEALCIELPTYAERIRKAAAHHIAQLEVFPFVLSHGDFSPNNIFAEGIIDLEDALSAPFGYDAICSVATADWYPDGVDFEFEVTPYHFTIAQKETYAHVCDAVSTQAGHPPISEYAGHFEFFRAVWLTEGMSTWPKTQTYRHARFVEKYLGVTYGGK